MDILIAEDQVDQAQLLGDLVSLWGFEPQLVHDGRVALRILKTPDAPRLALLDWEMPGLDGTEVCRKVRNDPDLPYTYVVLLTGLGGVVERLTGLDAGADDFLAKPVEPDELRARLNIGRRILHLQEQLLATQRRLQEQATRDALTGIWNRAAVLEMLERELARATRQKTPVGVLLIDLDHFKLVNDTHGHLAGDRVLREVAQRLLTELRPYDAVGRYGGEEFLVVLPGCDAGVTLRLAERLRNAVADEPVDAGEVRLPITLSVGAACRVDGSAEGVEVLRAADAALYCAKREGRNRAVLAEGLTPSVTASPTPAPVGGPGQP